MSIRKTVLLIAVVLLNCAPIPAQGQSVVTTSATTAENTIPHRFIRNRFRIEDRLYEATGFLREGETCISYDKMMARVPRIVSDTPELMFLQANKSKIPLSLRLNMLATGVRFRTSSGEPSHGVAFFIWLEEENRWHKFFIPHTVDEACFDSEFLALSRVE